MAFGSWTYGWADKKQNQWMTCFVTCGAIYLFFGLLSFGLLLKAKVILDRLEQDNSRKLNSVLYHKSPFDNDTTELEFEMSIDRTFDYKDNEDDCVDLLNED